jgi:hypothetical protein
LYCTQAFLQITTPHVSSPAAHSAGKGIWL